MIKKIIIFSMITSIISADIIDFYKESIKKLKYNEIYNLKEKSNILSQKSIEESRYLNFSIEASQSLTKAENISNPFNILDIGFIDTIDLFNKSRYKIEELALDIKSQKVILNIQKEKLFISLANMISLYRKTEEKLALHSELLEEQKRGYSKLKILKELGEVSKLTLLQFKNRVIDFKSRVIEERNLITKMKKRLELYGSDIPILEDNKLQFTKDEFLKFNPKQELNNIAREKLMIESKKLKDKYLPDIKAGARYENNGDPTGYGDSLSLNINLSIPISKGDNLKRDALKIDSLTLNSKENEYRLDREREYIDRYQSYINSSEELELLENSLIDIQNELDIVNRAILKRYIDFNTYLETFRRYLKLKEKIIDLKYQKSLEATILNNISNGRIYE